jgi:hypothetical protein
MAFMVEKGLTQDNKKFRAVIEVGSVCKLGFKIM